MLLEIDREERRGQAVAVGIEGWTDDRPQPVGSSWYTPWKFVSEWLLAIILLVVLSPVIGLAALLVRLTSPGPGFYSQVRVGRNGRLYRIYKIRTMRHNCELKTGVVWATTNDPRVTPIGRFLRCTHIDELPQLWNVLRGEMSLVGPRPERPEFVVQLSDKIPNYMKRLHVRPGITGLAQVYLAPDSDLDSVRRKLRYDLRYVARSSPWLDWQIMIATALSCAGVRYHLTRRILFLPTAESIESEDSPSNSKEALAPQWETA